MYCIYKHTNKVNGKCYIGQTKTDIYRRWRKNGKGYYKQPKFYNAIQKYGWNNFDHKILEENIKTAEEANEKEKYWIKLFNCVENGYNAGEGGYNNDKIYLKKAVLKIDPNTLEIIKEYDSITSAIKNEHNTSISLACDGKYSKASGYYWVFKSDFSTWKPLIVKDNKKRIYQIDMNTRKIIREYESISSARKAIGKSKSHIQDCCHRKISYCDGYYWCFVEDYSDNWKSLKTKDNYVIKNLIVDLFDYDNIFIKRFYSLTEMSKYLNISLSTLSRSVKKGEYKNKYRFKIVDKIKR